MSARKLLLFGGIALAILGMSYGLWYAVFAEHQALDGIGHSLSSGFQAAAERNSAAAENSLLQYRQAKYAYDRQVDVHGHWIGMAMLLMVLAIALDRMSFSEKSKLLLAWALLFGSVLFPLGVLMQTWSYGPWPRAVAILGSALVTTALAGMILGFMRRQMDRVV
jgi:ABC-type iron transport system FetAB permease component